MENDLKNMLTDKLLFTFQVILLKYHLIIKRADKYEFRNQKHIRI
jgi:hypothetical protein